MRHAVTYAVCQHWCTTALGLPDDARMATEDCEGADRRMAMKWAIQSKMERWISRSLLWLANGCECGPSLGTAGTDLSGLFPALQQEMSLKAGGAVSKSWQGKRQRKWKREEVAEASEIATGGGGMVCHHAGIDAMDSGAPCMQRMVALAKAKSYHDKNRRLARSFIRCWLSDTSVSRRLRPNPTAS